MNPQIERLQALVAQLIARLEHERSESRRLASQLASREAELARRSTALKTCGARSRRSSAPPAAAIRGSEGERHA